ncbi:MAG TPA: protein kinase, partial [Phototrophicaceae bacterium]|nr:protein kinase [Phototrophicaceae bacterium]
TDFRLALAQEFRVLASLRHPNIISVLDYGFDVRPDDEPQPFYTMDLLPDAQPLVAYGQDQTPDMQIALLVQLFQALAYLHRRGIIHRDLKPDNVLVVIDGDGNPQVKVLDFGLALGRQQILEEDNGGVLVGTIAYLAPEVFQGALASIASDLYAAGVMVYEIVSGQHPFSRGHVGSMVEQIIRVDADCSHLDGNPQLQSLIQRLLAKSPEKRPVDALEVVRILNTCLGKSETPDTSDVRESYLQAAEFVGREAELNTLMQALNQVTAALLLRMEEFEQQTAGASIGSAWLVGGESGVGKSRLLEELRIQALVDGVLVLRGQTVGEGGAPYHLWRDALRRLVIYTELSDFEAGVLKVAVPDIETLIDRSVPDAPTIEPAAARNRLFTVIEALFKRQTQPVLLVLEDLHWATESLMILARLARMVGQIPLMIVASYRDDERPNLPRELPEMQVIRLERLPDEAIQRLSTAMLGQSGQNAEVVALLKRETEGNIFFIVEVVRALAEDSGDLANVGMRTLPEHVFTGGVNAVVRRRLERVPRAAMRLLNLAAIAGRELDLALLSQIAPEVRLDSWLMQCTSVLEVQDNRWRFAHDKLREALLKNLDTEPTRVMHGQVAAAMEKLYGDDPIHASALSYHWSKAGNTAKEGYNAAAAGTFALRNSAYRMAIQYLTRALELKAFVRRSDKTNLEEQLGRAHLALSQMTDSQKHFQQALQGFGYPMSQSTPALLVNTVRQIAEQAGHRLFPAQMIGRAALEKHQALLRSSSIYEQLGEIFYFANAALPTAMTVIKSVNLAERARAASADLAIGYAGMCVLMSVIPLHSQAEYYSQRSIEVARQVNDDPALGWACFLAGVYYTGVGKWEQARERLEEAFVINERVGDLRRWETSISTHTVLCTYIGQYQRSAELSALQEQSALRREDPQSILWSHCQALQNWLVVGKYHETPDALLTLEAMLPTTLTLAERIYGYGLAAWVRYRTGDRVAALRLAEMANRVGAGVKPLSFYCIAGYSGAADTLLALWEEGSTVGIRQQAGRACKLLRVFAGTFPIAKARAERCDGLRLWLQGKQDQAQRAWQHSARTALEMQMPYDEALAYYEIGRHLPEGDSTRQDYLKRALRLFERLGAIEAIQRVQKLTDQKLAK